MALQFPTMAEKALAEFNASEKTVALAKIAKRMGADVEKPFAGGMTYTFDDDTSIVVEGRGKSWKARTELP